MNSSRDVASKPITSGASNFRYRPSGVRVPANKSVPLIGALISCHVLLALLIYQWPIISTVHVYVTLGIGVWLAFSRVPLVRVAYLAAYCTGAEVLWRMTSASTYWEIGKYGVIVILLLALFRSQTFTVPRGPVLYITALLPAAILTFSQLDLGMAKDQISFNLSGPLALFICAIFFHNLELNLRQVRILLLAIAMPVVAIATTALVATLTASNIVWTDQSNFAASAGFGPNQVSSALALGTFALWLLPVIMPYRRTIVLLLLGLWFLVQSVLTFSRGGVVDTLSALAMMIVFLVASNRKYMSLLLPSIVGILVVVYALFPLLDSATLGMFSVRFSDPNTTNRIEIAQGDWELFFRNPILGVGVGLSTDYRTEIIGLTDAPHTEFTRLLAEHGLLGVVAGCLLFGMAMNNFLRADSTESRALVVASLVWAFMYMTNAAMRTVAPSFMIGLTFACFSVGKPKLSAKATVDP